MNSKAIVLFGLMISTVLLTGCFKITDATGADVIIQKDDLGAMFIGNEVVKTQTETLKALVKGSIYETGELMSVFGTCLTGEDEPFFNSYGQLSAWYPNGTQFIYDDNMSEIQTGYFVWQGNMTSVEGTYLTQMRCSIIGYPNITALAFGEWQNPYWVKRIALLNDSINNISVNLTPILDGIDGLNITLGNLSVQMNDSFEITWDMINYTNYNINLSTQFLNQSIYYVASVANSSVDRNDSYLAQLIQNLTGTLFYNNSGTLMNHTEEADYPVYWRQWNIKVNAFSTSGKKVSDPDAVCYINTTLTPSTTTMTPQGSYFEYSEFITSNSDFTWMVSCYYT